MGKLVDGNVLPATLSEVATYFTHVLGDPRTSKDITPRVLIAIQCDRYVARKVAANAHLVRLC